MSALILILYIAVIFVFSIWGRSFKTIEDFVLARGKLGPYALGLSFASSYASASLFLGVNGWSYSWGESVLFYTVSIFGFTILGLLFFAKRFRKIGVEQNSVSLADWVGNRYDSSVLRTGVAALTLFNVTYIAGQFIGVAYLLQSFFSELSLVLKRSKRISKILSDGNHFLVHLSAHAFHRTVCQG